MRYVIGLAFLGGAAWFVRAGLARRREAQPVVGVSPDASPRPLAALSVIARPLVLLALGYTGLKATLVYLAFDAGQVLSLLDLAGFLVFLAAYGVWFDAKTRDRAVALSSGSVVSSPHGHDTGHDDGGLVRRDRGDAPLRRHPGRRVARAPLGQPAAAAQPRARAR